MARWLFSTEHDCTGNSERGNTSECNHCVRALPSSHKPLSVCESPTDTKSDSDNFLGCKCRNTLRDQDRGTGQLGAPFSSMVRIILSSTQEWTRQDRKPYSECSCRGLQGQRNFLGCRVKNQQSTVLHCDYARQSSPVH